MDIEKKSGVYGIYVNGELVYIGSTTRTFGVRFIEHRERMIKGYKKQKNLYDYLRQRFAEGANIQLIPMVVIEDLKIKGKCITKRDVKIMELAFINFYLPRCNVEGIKTPFLIPYAEN